MNRLGMTLLLSLVVGLLPVNEAGSAPAERELAFRENYYDVEIREGRIWIVGYYGTVLHSSDRGRSWEVQAGGTKDALFRAVFVDHRRGWISGSYGTLLATRDGGKSWEAQQAPAAEHLFGLSFLDERVGWAVGSRGSVFHTENGGTLWTDRSLGQDVILNDVAFIDPEKGWAVGEFGRIYHTRDGGRSWVKQKSPGEVSFISGENRNFFRLLLAPLRNGGTGPRSGWAFGLDGLILGTREGEQWEIVHKNGGSRPVATVHHLFDAAIFSGRKWAVGERGTVVYSPEEEERWSPARLDVPPVSLNGIAFGSDGLGLIVGDRGVILATEDGGQRWRRIKIVSRGPGKGVGKVLQ